MINYKRFDIEYEGKKIVLDQSYRIPKQVHPIAKKISERILCREPKDYKPREQAGTVNNVNSIETLPLEKGEWLVMASCDYMLTATSKGYNLHAEVVGARDRKGLEELYRYISRVIKS